MTIVATGEIARYPYMMDLGLQTTGSNFTFDGASDLLAVVLHLPATGTISNVHYRVSGSTSPVCTLRTELRTVDATTGLPDAAGTLYGSSTSITSANPSTGNKTAAVNCTGATAGDLVAVVFDLSAYTSGNFTLLNRIGGAPNGAINAFPYNVQNTTGATAVTVFALNCIALEYGTDTFYPLEISAIVGSLTSLTVSNSGVTRRGNRIRSAVPRRAVGMYVFGDMDGDALLRLRLASDDSVLATATLDKDVRGATSTSYHEVFFDSRATATLAANTDYYALVEGNSATTCAIQLATNIPSNGVLDQLNGGRNCYGTSYNAGYTDATTTRYGVGILYDGLDNGAGASGGGIRMAGVGGLAAC